MGTRCLAVRLKTVLRFSHAAAEQARQAAAAEHAQAELARESDRAQNAADMLHQQRQVQTQRTQEWLQLAQKTHVAFTRLLNLVIFEFNHDIYDTVLASAPPDPAFAKGRQMHEMMTVQFQKDTLTPQMLEAFANDENGYLVDEVARMLRGPSSRQFTITYKLYNFIFTIIYYSSAPHHLAPWP